ncbi:MAG: wax ester/triacylglycerol synthase family O-acyltransferase, partial [Actinomycetota bacterium]|nr:wax ester/triacylglycerol synthase family O-acyltransferase [Actinomycetota bacterium]
MEKTSSQTTQRGFEPLSGMDAGFLYMETPTLHMHTLKVAIMRPSEGVPAVTFEGFQRTLQRKIALLPSFHRRVVEIPYSLGHPV